MHYIPQNKVLWKLDNYENFLEARKKLIFNKMKEIGLVADQGI